MVSAFCEECDRQPLIIRQISEATMISFETKVILHEEARAQRRAEKEKRGEERTLRREERKKKKREGVRFMENSADLVRSSLKFIRFR